MPSTSRAPLSGKAALTKPNRNAGSAPITRNADLAGSRNGIERERITDIQRARLLTAMTQAAAEHGAANVTVAHVVERAGVSRRTFYEIFHDAEDCLLAAIDDATAIASERVLAAYGAPGRWRGRIRAGLTALLQLFDEDPTLARLLVVETLAAGHRSLRRRHEALRPLIATVDRGREQAKAGAGPPPLAAESAVGAVFSLLHERIAGDWPGALVELVNPMMGIIVLPYLGAAAARRELARPVPQAPARSKLIDGGPLSTLQMRLTYRTVRVLCAVAANPVASNRRIAQASGITDQGQISKLLARLEKLGLVSNTVRARAGRGEPNAWTLTQAGEAVHASIAHA